MSGGVELCGTPHDGVEDVARRENAGSELGGGGAAAAVAAATAPPEGSSGVTLQSFLRSKPRNFLKWEWAPANGFHHAGAENVEGCRNASLASAPSVLFVYSPTSTTVSTQSDVNGTPTTIAAPYSSASPASGAFPLLFGGGDGMGTRSPATCALPSVVDVTPGTSYSQPAGVSSNCTTRYGMFNSTCAGASGQPVPDRYSHSGEVSAGHDNAYDRDSGSDASSSSLLEDGDEVEVELDDNGDDGGRDVTSESDAPAGEESHAGPAASLTAEVIDDHALRERSVAAAAVDPCPATAVGKNPSSLDYKHCAAPQGTMSSAGVCGGQRRHHSAGSRHVNHAAGNKKLKLKLFAPGTSVVGGNRARPGRRRISSAVAGQLNMSNIDGISPFYSIPVSHQGPEYFAGAPQDGLKALIIIMVGLPARGKTFLAQKICRLLGWHGCKARVLNVQIAWKNLIREWRKTKRQMDALRRSSATLLHSSAAMRSVQSPHGTHSGIQAESGVLSDHMSHSWSPSTLKTSDLCGSLQSAPTHSFSVSPQVSGAPPVAAAWQAGPTKKSDGAGEGGCLGSSGWCSSLDCASPLGTSLPAAASDGALPRVPQAPPSHLANLPPLPSDSCSTMEAGGLHSSCPLSCGNSHCSPLNIPNYDSFASRDGASRGSRATADAEQSHMFYASSEDFKSLVEDPSGEARRLYRQVLRKFAEEAKKFFLQGGEVMVLNDDFPTADLRDEAEALFAPLAYQTIFLEVIRSEDLNDKFNELKVNDASEYPMELNGAEAKSDFARRVAYLNSVYVPLSPDTGKSYIQIRNSSILEIHRVAGYTASRIVSYAMNLSQMKVQHPIFFVRHGESMYNLEDRIGGNPELTPKGVDDSKCLLEFLASLKLHYSTTAVSPDMVPGDLAAITTDPPIEIWTSQLRRAMQTAEPSERVCGIKTLRWSSLNEIHAGVCEDLTYAEVREKYPLIDHFRRDNKYSFRYPRGESYQDLVMRLEPVIMELENANRIVVVVAHQAVLRALLAYFGSTSAERSVRVKVPQRTVWRCTYDSKGITSLEELKMDIPDGGFVPVGESGMP